MRDLQHGKDDPSGTLPWQTCYSLHEDPFLADGKYFYADPGREQTLNLLKHLTQYSEELLLVSGPAGSGKSTLLEQYVLRADESWLICRLDSAGLTGAGELFLAIAQGFGLRTAHLEPRHILDALRARLEHLQLSRVPVLLLDDADMLGADALEVIVRLAELTGEHGHLLRILLFARSDLLVHFSTPRFANAVHPHPVELQPLDERQTLAYLQHRLAVAGFSGDLSFQSADIRYIQKHARGWPGGINRLAREVLLGRKQDRRSWILPAVLLTLLLVAGGLTVLKWKPMEPVENAFILLPPVELHEPSEAVELHKPESPSVAVDVSAGEELSAVDKAEEGEHPLQDDTGTVPTAMTDRDGAGAQEQQEAMPVVVEEEPVSGAEQVTEGSGRPSRPDQGRVWLAERDPAHFCIQIVSAASEQSLHDTLQQNPLPGDVVVLHAQRNARPWHVAFWGDFASRDAAQQALSGLPPALQRSGPWIRLFADLQRDYPAGVDQ